MSEQEWKQRGQIAGCCKNVGLDLGSHSGGGGKKAPSNLNFPRKDYLISYY